MSLCSTVMKTLIFFTFSLHLSSTVTHSLQYFYTGITPGINLPEFTAVGLLDGQHFGCYDSKRREVIKTEWIRSDDPDHWNRITGIAKDHQVAFKAHVITQMQRFNQTTGVHTVQQMFGCELDDDRTVRGYKQYGYDGDDFISFDLTTLTWTAAKSQAVMTKNKWDNYPAKNNEWKNFLEKECINWLNKYMSYGRKTLERKVRPETSLFQKHSPSPEVLCHATGFFPKAVMISWRKDGEDVHEDVELRETLPNQDGSFQKRSILQVPYEELEEHNYTCVIQHSSLEEELVLPMDIIEPQIISCYFGDYDEDLGGLSRGGKIAIIIGVVVVLVASVAGFLIWKKSKMSDLFKHVPLSSNA